MIPPLLENVWKFFISLKILLTIDSAMLLLGIQIRKTKTSVHGTTHTSMFIKDLFIIPQNGNNSNACQQKSGIFLPWNMTQP